MWRQSPYLKGGTGGKTLSLGCFCACIGGCRGISALYFPHPKVGGWKGFAHVFIANHTKSKSLVVFRGKHWKNNADLSPIFTKLDYYNKYLLWVLMNFVHSTMMPHCKVLPYSFHIVVGLLPLFDEPNSKAGQDCLNSSNDYNLFCSSICHFVPCNTTNSRNTVEVYC